jgi:transposase-like protein
MIRSSKLTSQKQKKLIEHFCADIDATKTALILVLNRKTVNRYYMIFREAIYEHQKREKAKLTGIVEVDESYFGATRMRGNNGPKKRGRGTKKLPVFGVFERGGRVYTEIIPDAKKITLQAIIRGKVSLKSAIISDGWKGYDGLVDVGYDKHLRINHSKEFSRRGVHINGIESFWSFTKRRLAKFNGVKGNFHLHIKECEWRWNKNFEFLCLELYAILKTHLMV